jgi:hypothetical protein
MTTEVVTIKYQCICHSNMDIIFSYVMHIAISLKSEEGYVTCKATFMQLKAGITGITYA